VRALRKAKSICLVEKLYRVTAIAALAAITSVACDRPSSGQNLTRDEPKATTSAERSSGWFSAPAWFSDRNLERNTTQIREALGGKQPTIKISQFSIDTTPLRHVYEGRGFQPLWTGSLAAQYDAQRVLEQIKHADEDGLHTEDYRTDALAGLVAADRDNPDFELLLTDSVLRYAHDLRSGRVKPNDVDEDIALPAIGFDYAKALGDAAGSHGLTRYLADMAPKHPEYVGLRQALGRYRAIDVGGGWGTLPAGTKLSGPRAELLRARLAAEDNMVPADAGGLTDALKRYQQRNGLEADGVPGPKTLAALNVPASERVNQILANMERWRWMPRDFEARYVVVNVTDATLKFVDNGRTVLASKIVVGQPEWRTPILRTEAKAVTVNPVWHVPSSIATKEYLPKLQMDPHFLESEGLVIVGGPRDDPQGMNIDWASKTEFPYMIEQPPGPKNALGTLKFEMPNKFGVYLHDTPAKSAFNAEMRTLSHGCMRVQEIAPLVSLAYAGDPQSALTEISQKIAAGETTKLNLDRPLPVYVLYWTAFVDQGAMNFRSDVYGRDEALLAALKGEHATRRAVAELGI